MAMASMTHTPFAHPQSNALLTALTSSTTLSQLKQVHAQILRSNPQHSNSLLFKLVLSSCTLSSSSSSSALHYALRFLPNSKPRHPFLQPTPSSLLSQPHAREDPLPLSQAQERWLHSRPLQLPPIVEGRLKSFRLQSGLGDSWPGFQVGLRL